MTAGQVWALVKGGLVALFGLFGWAKAEDLGEAKAERDQARRERDAERAKSERMARAIKTPTQRQAAARAELDRRDSLRDSAGRH